jgi:hypothetical protein
MLNNIFSLDELSARLDSELIVDEFGKDQIADIANVKPDGLFGIGANVWNRIVQNRWHAVNPIQFARYFQNDDPALHIAISHRLRIEVIHDIYYVKGWKESREEDNLVAEFLVAHVYPNDLQLADLTFIDPTRPIPEEDRVFMHQTHHGLGLLPLLMENLHRKAVELGCDQMTLTSASQDQAPLFERYGFSVEDSDVGVLAMENGFGIPMERDV